MNAIEANARRIMQEVEEASAGRTTLIAVSKYMPLEYIQAARDAGVLHFGENRAQELRDKAPVFPDVSWHFIGQLQQNKVKYVVGRACLIHSVDRAALAQEIQRLAAAKELTQDILVEIRLEENPLRGGVAPEELDALLDAILPLSRVRLRGFMGVPPVGQPSEPSFEKMFTLFERYRTQLPQLDTLSMGMSQDYLTAIRCGATMVRVGSSIFGPRPAPAAKQEE